MKITLLIILITTQLSNAQYHQLQSTASNLQPSLLAVIGLLSFMFCITLLLLIYAKFCHRQPTAIHNVSANANNQPGGMFGHNTRFSGIDKTVVEALPLFRFSSLRGSNHGLQCAVCLADYEEVELLKLLPKCQHGFHIECVDQWLQHHSSCPICRQKVSAEDITTLINSTSMRFVTAGQKSGAGDAASSNNFELLLERENDDQRSSRFSSLGGSFRRVFSVKKGEESTDLEGKALHRLNHQILVSDVVFKHRWSDASSSDLMYLNSEMLGDTSSDRFSTKNMSFVDSDEYRSRNLREEMERERNFEYEIGQIKRSSSNPSLKIDMGFKDSSQINMNFSPRSSSLIPSDKRSMPKITTLTRSKDLRSMKNELRQCSTNSEINIRRIHNDDYVRDDIIIMRNRWFPIGKSTVQWFAHREKNRSNQHQQTQNTSMTLEV